MAKKFKLGPLQRKWLNALRSGKFKQTKKRLRTDAGFCCLGVACEISGAVQHRRHEGGSHFYGKYSDTSLPPTVQRLFKFKDNIGGITGGDSLADMNDGGKSFKRIAAFAEANPELIFKRPA